MLVASNFTIEVTTVMSFCENLFDNKVDLRFTADVDCTFKLCLLWYHDPGLRRPVSSRARHTSVVTPTEAGELHVCLRVHCRERGGVAELETHCHGEVVEQEHVDNAHMQLTGKTVLEL